MGRKPRRRAASKYDGLTEDQKRALVISEGTRMEQLVCPLCGLNKPLNKATFEVDLEEGVILLVRYAGGYGSGFQTNLPESKVLKEIKDDPKYASHMESIRVQCRKVLKALE